MPSGQEQPKTTQVELDSQLLKDTEVVKPVKLEKYDVLRFVKHPCIARCADFEFVLNNEGTVFMHCKSECGPSLYSGYFNAFIGREKVVEFMRHIRDNGMRAYAAQYPSGSPPVEGIPLTEFELGFDDGNIKRIRNYHHAPLPLLELEEMVEKLIDEIKWQRSIE